MTTSSTPLEIRKSRGFGELINLTFAFLRQNFKKLSKSVLYIVGPPALVTGVLVGGNYLDLILSLEETALGFGDIPFSTITTIAIGMLLGFIASLLMIGVVNHFVFLYMERGPDGFDVRDVWEETRGSLGRIFLTGLGVGAIAIGAYLLMIALLAAGTVMESGLIIFFGVLVTLAVVAAAIYFMVTLTPLFTARLYEPIGILEAISRSMQLVKGHWWETLGIIFVVGMVANFISSILMFPVWIIMMIANISSMEGGEQMMNTGVLGVVVTVLLMLALIINYLIAAVPMLSITLQYFNLVEKAEGVGIMSKIEQLGETEDRESVGGTTF